MISSSTSLHAVARVDQNKNAAQGWPTRQVLLEQALPFLDHSDGRIGKAIARQVDHVDVARGEEVDLLRAAGRVGRTRKPLAPGQAR